MTEKPGATLVSSSSAGVRPTESCERAHSSVVNVTAMSADPATASGPKVIVGATTSGSVVWPGPMTTVGDAATEVIAAPAADWSAVSRSPTANERSAPLSSGALPVRPKPNTVIWPFNGL